MRAHSPLAVPPLVLGFAVLAAEAAPTAAQVHHFPDGRPWSQRARSGPDAEVPGWYYNLGATGLRVELIDEAPEALLVRYVFGGSPADGLVRVGDRIVGAGGRRFETPHRDGYGMQVFGADGPILDFARALEAAQAEDGDGRLALALSRDGKGREVALEVGTPGAWGATFPADSPRAERALARLLAFLIEEQREDGSWGSPPQDTFAPLALLASGEARYLPAVERAARFHARTTAAEDDTPLINWRYMAAAVVLSEYQLATGAEWVLPELREVYAFLVQSQYTDLSQLNPRARETHPDAVPEGPLDSHGGWGHNPGFEGYGPIAMLSGQGALSFALMARCGVAVDPERHDAALAFLERASGRNGYVWYGDQAAGDDDWADMGRTGAAAIALQLAPDADGARAKRALRHARVIGAHPESWPDTHGSPVMGMAYAALGAAVDPPGFRRLMDANRWWFTLAECPDGSFYYQPNRDNAGYGADSRVSASAAVALVLSIPRHSLAVTGRGEAR